MKVHKLTSVGEIIIIVFAVLCGLYLGYLWGKYDEMEAHTPEETEYTLPDVRAGEVEDALIGGYIAVYIRNILDDKIEQIIASNIFSKMKVQEKLDDITGRLEKLETTYPVQLKVTGTAGWYEYKPQTAEISYHANHPKHHLIREKGHFENTRRYHHKGIMTEEKEKELEEIVGVAGVFVEDKYYFNVRKGVAFSWDKVEEEIKRILNVTIKDKPPIDNEGCFTYDDGHLINGRCLKELDITVSELTRDSFSLSFRCPTTYSYLNYVPKHGQPYECDGKQFVNYGNGVFLIRD